MNTFRSGRVLVLTTVLAIIAGPVAAAAGECAAYGKKFESQCLAAAQEGRVRRMSVAQKLCRDAMASATKECKREFTGISEYYQQSVASKGYRYTRCEYWGWAAQQFVYWRYLQDSEGKYAGTWDDVVRPIYQSIPGIVTDACKRKL